MIVSRPPHTPPTINDVAEGCDLGGHDAATNDNESAQVDHSLPNVLGEMTDTLAAWGLHL
jgi:hypothetical protein